MWPMGLLYLMNTMNKVIDKTKIIYFFIFFTLNLTLIDGLSMWLKSTNLQFAADEFVYYLYNIVWFDVNFLICLTVRALHSSKQSQPGTNGQRLCPDSMLHPCNQYNNQTNILFLRPCTVNLLYSKCMYLLLISTCSFSILQISKMYLSNITFIQISEYMIWSL